MEFITLSGKKIGYKVKRNYKAKKIWLKLEDDDGLMVILPKGRKKTIVPKILRENKSWVLNSVKAREEKLKKAPPPLESSRVVMYRGRQVDIKVRNVACAKPRVRLINNALKVVMPKNTPEKVSDVLLNWLKERALLFFSRRVEYFASKLNLKYGTITVREQRTRWGSANSKGDLSFNWKLLFAPPEVFDYVVAHEVCHLKHYNHSNRFWKLLKSLLPYYEKSKEWLKENGVLLKV